MDLGPKRRSQWIFFTPHLPSLPVPHAWLFKTRRAGAAGSDGLTEASESREEWSPELRPGKETHSKLRSEVLD